MSLELIAPEDMRSRAKVQTHEHLDCSLRPQTMLELHEQLGFDKSPLPFPQDIIKAWKTSSPFYTRLRECWLGTTAAMQQIILKQRAQAVQAYHDYLCGFADASLENYLQAIRDHILPIMQSRENLTRITQERIEDAVADGHIALELRFAPQLHLAGGLTLDEVLESVAAPIKIAPIITNLTVCALRHEKDMKINGVPYIRALGDLCIKHANVISGFDLAGGEGVFPGILDWWMEEAIRVSEARNAMGHPIIIKCHLWEAVNPTAEDNRKLKELSQRLKQDKLIVGHGIRDRRASDIYKEVCITSEVVTRQTKTFADNPIKNFIHTGHRAYLNTDGTLFTRTTLTREYLLAQEAWEWGPKEFLQTNLWAVEAMNLPKSIKDWLAHQLVESWSK